MDEEELGQVHKDRERKRLSTRLVALVLLAVMICSIVGVPLAFVYRWYNARPEEQPTPTPALVEVEPSPTVGGLPLTKEPGERPSNQVDRIAYVTHDFQLATVAPDGTEQRLLTQGPQRFQFPAWSPDDLRLAAIAGSGVVIAGDEADATLKTIYDNEAEPPFYLYWSPDGRFVSFLANHPEGIALHMAQVVGSEPSTRLLAIGQPFYWDWLPGGDRILIHTGFTGEGARLTVIEPTGDGEGENIAEPGFFQAPGVSQSGLFWAFAEVDDEGNSQLVIVNQLGDRQASEPHLGQVALSWSPTEDKLAFSSPTVDSRAFYGPLRLLDVATGDIQTLSPEIVVSYFWSPDGQSIAYLTLPGREGGDVQVSFVPSGVQDSVGSLLRPSLQHDDLQLDLWIVDVETGFSRRLTTFEPTELFVSQFLPFFDQYALSHRIWSPDSEALVLPYVDQGTSRIGVLPTDGGPMQPVAEGEIGFWSHR